MAEYISREAAIEAVNLRCAESGHPTMFSLKNPLLSIPSADVRPVRHGRWMKSYADHEAFGVRPFFRYCSECHEATVHQYNYCPNCGARMDGDKE